MKKLLNTLYITSEGGLGAQGRSQCRGRDRRGGTGPRATAPSGAIVCFGQVGLSPQLMHACAEAGISITYLGHSGKFLAHVEGPVSGNILLRRAQHARTLDDPLPVARAMVAAKTANQRGVIRRQIRDHGDDDGAFLSEYDQAEDSLRFYFLGSNWRRRIEHRGAKPATDFDGTLIM